MLKIKIVAIKQVKIAKRKKSQRCVLYTCIELLDVVLLLVEMR